MQRRAIFPDQFVPEDFFVGRTTGAGVCYGPFGRMVARCFIETEGVQHPASETIHFDEVFTFDDGRIDKLHWAISRDGKGRITASEITVLGTPRTTLNGPVWRVCFRRLAGERGPALTYDSHFTWVAANVVVKQVRLKLFGLTVGRMVGFHRCEPQTAGARAAAA